MFQPTLMGQGTLDQQAEWLGKAWNLEIIGKLFHISMYILTCLDFDIEKSDHVPDVSNRETKSICQNWLYKMLTCGISY